MRKNTLASTASSLAIVALSASALLLAPQVARAANQQVGDASTVVLSTGNTGEFTGTSTGTANPPAGVLTIGDGITAGAITSDNGGVTSTTGVGVVTATVTGSTSSTAGLGSGTHYLNTVNINGSAVGNTVATTGNVFTNNLNVTTATQTISGTTTANAETLTGATVTHTGAATLGTVTANGASTLNLGAAGGHTVTNLNLNGTSIANINGTSTIGTLSGASGTTANVNAASTITTLNTVTGSTTNIGANTTVGTLSAGTGLVNITGGDVLTLTNGLSGVHAFEVGHAGNAITGAVNQNLNFSNSTLEFVTNGAQANKTDYVVATTSGTGTVTYTKNVTLSAAVAGDSFYFRTNAAHTQGYIVQLVDADYQSATVNAISGGSGAVNRASLSSYLESRIAGSSLDTGAVGTYMSALVAANAANTATGRATAAKILDQGSAQSTVQVSNDFATGLMNLTSDRTGVMQGTHVASNGNGGVSAGDASTGRAVWAEAFGSIGRQDTRGGQAGFDTSNGGFAIGAEKKFTSATAAGLAISYGAGRYESNEAGAPKLTTSDDYQASLYGSSYVYPNWYFDGQIGGGYHRFSEGNTTVAGTSSASYDGWGYFGQVGTGYDFHTSTPAVVTPFAKLAYQALDSNDYTESGAVARHISSDTAQTLTGFLGAKVAWQNLTYWNTKWTPSLRAAYFHDFEQEGLGSTVNFVGTGTGATYSNTGNNLAKDGYTVGAGLTAARANGWDFDVNYDYEGREGYNGHSGTLEAKYNF